MTNAPKTVLAIHDLPGFGRAALSVIVPVLSTLGVQAVALPTAVLSTHTGGLGTPAKLADPRYGPAALAQYHRLGIRFDCIYSGYLADAAQAKLVEQAFALWPHALKVVDPVLGDNGHLYKGITEEMVTEMKKLIHLADVITPNLTELYYLLDMPYQEHITDAELKQALKTLSDRGPAIVISTSVPVSGDPRSTSVYAYNRFGDRYWKVTCPYLPAHYPGTGDTFTSVITGALMQGDSLPIALDRATQFILQGIRATFGYEYNNLEGIMLEKVLHNLDMPIQISSYELVE